MKGWLVEYYAFIVKRPFDILDVFIKFGDQLLIYMQALQNTEFVIRAFVDELQIGTGSVEVDWS